MRPSFPICIGNTEMNSEHQNNFFLGKNEHSDCIETCNLDNEMDLLQFIQRKMQISVNGSVFRPKWIKHNSIRYQSGAFLFVKPGVLYPTFVKLLCIYAIESQVVVKVQAYETMSIHSVCNAFTVTELPNTQLLLIEQLPQVPVFHPRRLYDKNDTSLYLSPKQFIIA